MQNKNYILLLLIGLLVILGCGGMPAVIGTPTDLALATATQNTPMV